MAEEKNNQSERLTLNQKKANKFRWYRDKMDELEIGHHGIYSSQGGGDVSDYKRMLVNYDLFNNVLNLDDFSHVCQPHGAEAGELPAKMVNRDISSGKIKAVLGMEAKRPFDYKLIATNSEATSRVEREEFDRIKEFVQQEVMGPIREKVEMQYQEQLQGGKLSEEDTAQIKQKMQEEITAKTPPETRKYMEREHQDPAEVMGHQLLEYLSKKCDVKQKFDKAFKHLHLSAKEVMYVGIMNGEPEVWNVNSLRFNCDKSPDVDFIEDGEWATCEYRMTPSSVVKYFGEELTNKEIDSVYQLSAKKNVNYLKDSLFNFDAYQDDDADTVRVIHCVWKGLRAIKFLTYKSPEGEELEKIVDESYKLNIEAGDVSIEVRWIPEAYEGWKVHEAYVRMGPIMGQPKDLSNIFECKLPYYGAICDDLNSEATCLMDRLKVYQYYFDIVMFRLDLLLASDKGKKILMNINAIPDSDGMDIKKWQHFMESSPFIYYNPDEEGSSMDANNVAKVIDLSLLSDIGKYIEIAEYLKKQAGESVGITPAVEGQSSPYESVGNNRTNIAASSNILEPYFKLHSYVKRNVLTALIETAKIAYHGKETVALSYVLDDMSRKVLNLDMGLLDGTTLGLFIDDSSKASEVKDMIKGFAHAALQNQSIELSDVISVIRQEGVAEAEETLKVAEQDRHDKGLEQQKAASDSAKEMKELENQQAEVEHKRTKELIVLKEEERRKTEVIKSTLVGASFNPDQDKDGDGENDFVELAREGLNADIKQSKQDLDREKFEHQKVQDAEKNDLEKQKLKAASAGNTEKS